MLSESCNRVDADSGLSGSGSGTNSPGNNQTSSTRIVTRMLRICDSKWSSSSNQRLNRESSTYNTPENLEQIQNLYTSSSGSATNSAMLTETVLDCEDSLTGHKYNLLQSAHFHELVDDNSILFMTFNSSTRPTSSVVCKLTIKQIDAHFVTMLRKCIDGDNSFAELVSPYSNKYTWKTPCRCSIITEFSRKLSQFDASNERKLFCHNDLFNYMNSRRTLTMYSIKTELGNRKPITSIATANVNKGDAHRLAIILATLDAQIYMLDYDLHTDFARIYDQVGLVNVKSASIKPPVMSSSAALDINLVVVESELTNSTRHVLYATYDKYLYKINLQNCDQYRTCEMCLNGADNP